MFQTPQEQSGVSGDKEPKLKAYIRADRPITNSTTINGSAQDGNGLNNITNYLNVHHSGFQEFVLKRIMKSDYERLVDEYRDKNKVWTDPDFPPELQLHWIRVERDEPYIKALETALVQFNAEVQETVATLQQMINQKKAA